MPGASIPNLGGSIPNLVEGLRISGYLSDIKLETRADMFHSRVRYQDLSDHIRETNGHRSGVAELAGVVIQLGQSENILRDLCDVGITVLNVNP